MHRGALRRLAEKAPAGSTVPVSREVLLELLKIDDFNAAAPTNKQIQAAYKWYYHLREQQAYQSANAVATCWLKAWVKVRLGEEPPQEREA